MNKRFSKGFTLIELLVVIAIISLLTSVVLAALGTSKEKAQAQGFRSEILQLVNAIELYRLNNNNSLPPLHTTTGIYTISSTGTENNPPTSAALAPYIKKIPTPKVGITTLSIFSKDIANMQTYCPAAYTGNASYVIVLNGGNTITLNKYFSDWTTGNPVTYKCFYLK